MHQTVYNQKNDLYPTTYQTLWTPSAIECWERGCICKGCIYQEFFEKRDHNCKMKNAVLELVRTIGTPPGIEEKGII